MHSLASELGVVDDSAGGAVAGAVTVGAIVGAVSAGAAGGITSIVNCLESVPPGPWAIRVYVVRLFGTTCLDPFFSTLPPSIETSSACSVCQLNCAGWPGWIEVALGVKKGMTGFGLDWKS